MDSIDKNALKQRYAYKSTERISERGELMKAFMAGILPTWDAQKFGKMTYPRLAKKLQDVPTQDLYYLKRVCEDSKHYAKRFFFELSAEKHKEV